MWSIVLCPSQHSGTSEYELLLLAFHSLSVDTQCLVLQWALDLLVDFEEPLSASALAASRFAAPPLPPTARTPAPARHQEVCALSAFAEGSRGVEKGNGRGHSGADAPPDWLLASREMTGECEGIATSEAIRVWREAVAPHAASQPYRENGTTRPSDPTPMRASRCRPQVSRAWRFSLS